MAAVLMAVLTLSILSDSHAASSRILRGDWESTGWPVPMSPESSYRCRIEVTNAQFVTDKGTLYAYTDVELNEQNNWSLEMDKQTLKWNWLWLFFHEETPLKTRPKEGLSFTKSQCVSEQRRHCRYEP